MIKRLCIAVGDTGSLLQPGKNKAFLRYGAARAITRLEEYVMSTHISAQSSTVSHALSARLGAAFAAALLGLVILFGAALAPQSAVHNAAHDTRHSFAFPCH